MFHPGTGCYILLLQRWQLCCILDILWAHFDLILAGSQLSWMTMNANTLRFLSVNTSHSFLGKWPYAMFSHYSFLTQRADFTHCLWRKKDNSMQLLLQFKKLNLVQCQIKNGMRLHCCINRRRGIPLSRTRNRGDSRKVIPPIIFFSEFPWVRGLASVVMHVFQSCCAGTSKHVSSRSVFRLK